MYLLSPPEVAICNFFYCSLDGGASRVARDLSILLNIYIPKSFTDFASIVDDWSALEWALFVSKMTA